MPSPYFDDNVSSRGFSMGGGSGGGSSDMALGLGNTIAKLALSATYDPETDPNRARARLLNAQASEQETINTGRGKLADVIDQMAANIEQNPQGAAQMFRSYAAQTAGTAARYGYKPKDLADLMLSFGGMAGADNSTMMNLRAGTGAAPLNPDAALTQDRQDQIRGQDFSQEVSIQNMKNRGEQTKPQKLDFGDMDKVDAEINAQIGDGTEMDSALKGSVRSRASQLYRSGIDPATSVAEALSQLSERKVNKGWFSDTVQYAPKSSPVQTGPKPGDIIDGYRFKGGNPKDQNAWEPVS